MSRNEMFLFVAASNRELLTLDSVTIDDTSSPLQCKSTLMAHKFELAENKRVSESRFIILDTVLPEYNQALPEP